MIRMTLLYKNGEQRVVNIHTEEEEKQLTEQDRFKALDDILKLVDNTDHLRISENENRRIYINTNEVVHASAEFIEEE